MVQQVENSQELRRSILKQLQEHFGDDRSSELADFDRMDLMIKFLRRIPTEDVEDAVTEDDEFTKSDLIELRQRRKQQKQAKAKSPSPGEGLGEEASSQHAQEGDSILASMKISDIIGELPDIRNNFAEWLGGVDTEGSLGSSSLSELENLHKDVAYRESLLKVMLNATQRELDELTIHIRAKAMTQ